MDVFLLRPPHLCAGSELILFNTRSGSDVLGQVKYRLVPENISVLHVEGDPLDQEDLAAKLDVSRYVFSLSIRKQILFDVVLCYVTQIHAMRDVLMQLF